MAEPTSRLRQQAHDTYRYLESGLDYHRRFLDRSIPGRGLVADVGCGLGRVANLFADGSRRTIGFDTDVAALAAAQSLGRTSFVCANAFGLPLRDRSLAAFVGLGIIEFDPAGGRSLVAEATRLLEPGGVLYLSAPFRNVQRRRSGRAEWRGHDLKAFTVAEVEQLLKPDFEVVLIRPSSLAWGIGPFRPAARLLRRALVQEDDRALSYRLLFPVLRNFANSLLIIARRR
jgi:SAM-dependent methyltransferase